MDQIESSNWLIVAALALPHLFYSFVWFFPQRWMAIFKKEACQMMENIAWLMKAFQFSSVFYWFVLRNPNFDIFAVKPLELLLALALAIPGQALNVGIYNAIGHKGVYYGFKLGHTIPWVDGFPFNVVSHPQYIGSVMSVWAGLALLWSQAPSGLGLLAVYWTVLYVITGWMEHSL